MVFSLLSWNISCGVEKPAVSILRVLKAIEYLLSDKSYYQSENLKSIFRNLMYVYEK